MAKINDILKEYWGYDSFRPMQREVIEAVCGGNDVLALLPTGGGKSIMYQAAALSMEGICLVVTPLIALMNDQVAALRRRKISAVAVNSSMSYKEIDIVLDNCVYGDCKFLYVSPERLETEIFRLRFAKMNVCLIAVDEAHCISQWGYDFRPSYLNIAQIRPLAPEAPVLAVTATATARVADDIMEKLCFRMPLVKCTTFARDNISFVVRQTENKQEQLLRIINGVRGQGIVYSRSRGRVEEIAKMLQQNGVSAEAYHAGMGYALRRMKQQAWSRGEMRVIVATNAFGMGIDKPDVRFVAHWEPSASPEEYYQEAGRAGRDGKPAYAVLLYSASDIESARSRFRMEFPTMEQIKSTYEAVFNYLQIPVGAGQFATREFNLHDFSYKFKLYPATARSAIDILDLNGYMTLTDEMEFPTRIMFTVPRDSLYRVQVEQKQLETFIKAMLRHYPGMFTEMVPVDEEHMAHVTGYTVEQIREFVLTLGQIRIIRYTLRRRCPMLVLREERLPSGNIVLSPSSYAQRKESAVARIGSMIAYYTNTERCRPAMLREYFGEKECPPCGCCDVCRAKKGGAGGKTGEMIHEILAAEEHTINSLAERIGNNLTTTIRIAEELQAEGSVTLTPDGKLKPVK